MYKTLLILYESWCTFCRYHFQPKLDAIWENFLTPQNWLFGGPFGFLAQNAGNHVQNIANIVWIVIYACSRSFWARTRLDLRDFFDAPKFSFWRAILGFWPKTLKIIYKSWQILYESWSTRSRDHFERKFASIWQSKNSLPLRRVWAENYPGYAYITIHTILPMICTWFLSFLAKNPKWHIKGPKFGRPKILSNRSKFGLKWPRAYVDHDSYNISNDLYMIFIVFGQKPKMALQGPQIRPYKNSLQLRRVWAQTERGYA